MHCSRICVTSLTPPNHRPRKGWINSDFLTEFNRINNLGPERGFFHGEMHELQLQSRA